MATQALELDWSVTPEKVAEALRRIIQAAGPLQIIAFGSRARGDHRPDSDLDLAVILDAPQSEVRKRLPFSVLSGVNMGIDLVVASKTKYDDHRPWINSVFNYIDCEGVILYDRDNPQQARPDAVHTSPGGRIHSLLPASGSDLRIPRPAELRETA